MTREDKELLLKDLCERLTYWVILRINGRVIEQLYSIDKHKNTEDWFVNGLNIDLIEVKPYLRPMSSMTDEEEKELKKIHHQFYNGNFIDAGVFSADDCGCTVFEMSNILNYLRTRNFDYCGLIEKGLAIEAPDGMYEG